MAEITRVPLQPVAKGSLTKLWAGVVIVLLLAAAAAWFVLPRGVTVETLTAGTGPSPTETDVVFVHYVGKLDDGTVFDQSQDLPLPVPGILPAGTPMQLGQMIPGFKEALLKMQKGGKYIAYLPADKAYGDQQQGPIPPNSDLTFEIELVDFMSEQEAQQRFMAMQQMMQQAQQQQQGAPGGVPGAAPAGPDGAPPAPMVP
ncbi:peptidylprolyl isomerase [Altererythrobacter xixiisoli]|uniref:Peptidyl-prolyl cis-trans isomerase n=1 Tax=Croceibacterium xixiisoli TaxID=1476466 RepID=A0A6I4TQ95_9SPHN|nr:FKBP-type peptidyl-prolyl cis-trans isomerase [Croceibacterium xixiisoli]MXO98122.1 peptidylprolyl isomerase [Croceibacterium xixiisoli]